MALKGIGVLLIAASFVGVARFDDADRSEEPRRRLIGRVIDDRGEPANR
jgi:hypothetical protein